MTGKSITKGQYNFLLVHNVQLLRMAKGGRRSTIAYLVAVLAEMGGIVTMDSMEKERERGRETGIEVHSGAARPTVAALTRKKKKIIGPRQKNGAGRNFPLRGAEQWAGWASVTRSTLGEIYLSGSLGGADAICAGRPTHHHACSVGLQTGIADTDVVGRERQSRAEKSTAEQS